MEQIIKDTKEYVKTILGTNLKTQIYTYTQNLPFFIINMYRLYKADLAEYKLLFPIPTTDEYATPSQLKKHQEIIGNVSNLPVVFILASMPVT